MNRLDLDLLLFALGVVLVLNPVLLFPVGTPYVDSVTYRAEPVDDVADRNVGPETRILDCTGEVRTFDCFQAHQIGYDGTLAVQLESVPGLADGDPALEADFDYVRFHEGYASPIASVRNGTLVLSLEPESATAVMEASAASFDELPPIGRSAVRSGEASTTRYVLDYDDVSPPVPDRRRLVERNGTYYHLEVVESSSNPVVPGFVLDLVKLGGVAVGVGLILFARGRIADPTAHAPESVDG